MSIDFYSKGGYFEKHPTWHTEDAPWKAKNILKMIQKNHLDLNSVCEIGCGTGEILKELQKQLPGKVKLDGFDIAPQALELAKQKENDNLKFHLKSLIEIPDDNSYDLALLIDVFEHVEDYYGFIKSCRSKAKNTIFHIPLDLSVQSVLRSDPLLRKRKNSGHIHYFTKDTALASLTDGGYEIVDYFYTGSYIDLPSRTFKSRLAKIPRRLLYAINKDAAARILGGFSLMVLAK